MKALVSGVRVMSGVGQKSGQPYNFGTAFILNQISPVQREHMTMQGYGFEVGEIALSPEALQHFQGQKFPAILDLNTDMELRGGNMVPIVVGINS